MFSLVLVGMRAAGWMHAVSHLSCKSTCIKFWEDPRQTLIELGKFRGNSASKSHKFCPSVTFLRMSYSEEHLKEKLTKAFEPVTIAVTDLSDGCGGKFEVLVRIFSLKSHCISIVVVWTHRLQIVSASFEGKPLLARHKLVYGVLEEEMVEWSIHDLRHCVPHVKRVNFYF